MIGDLRRLHSGLSGIVSNSLSDESEAVENEEELPEETKWNLDIPSNIEASIRKSNSDAIQRIQQLYIKLACSLRTTVNQIFLSQFDVLEAGTEIQVSKISFFLLFRKFHSFNVLFVHLHF